MVKLLMSWDIKSGLESTYFDFVVNEFAPGLLRLGVQPTEAWYTVYGSGPQILTGGVAKDLETMTRILIAKSGTIYKVISSSTSPISNTE